MIEIFDKNNGDKKLRRSYEDYIPVPTETGETAETETEPTETAETETEPTETAETETEPTETEK